MSPIWQPAPPQPPPLAGEVHVWGASLELPDAELTRLEPLLSAEERARADRFRRPADRRRFLAAHGMLRTLLGAYLDLDPGAVVLGEGVNGKPFLHSPAGKPSIRFNLTHTASVAAVAFSAEREVGIDLESSERSYRDNAIAERYFPPSEAARLRALPEPERGLAFLRSWVCKEAFAKARGSGLANLDVHTIAVSLPLGGQASFEGVTEAARQALAGWTLLELPRLHGCPGALVVDGSGWTPRFWLWQGG